jgi:tRNA(Ser,Leu) C12 N-acetylase TAN1
MKLAKRDVTYLKPPRFAHYLTLSELCVAVERDPSWIRLLEKDGRIPRAQRVKRGRIEVRLWSPAQVEEIKAIIATHRPGRPRNA